jgi:hypothetical protein
MRPTVTKKAFLDWYFDFDTKKSIGFDLVDELILTGSISRTVKDVYKCAGYIPASICENITQEQKDDIELEYDPSEVDLID